MNHTMKKLLVILAALCLFGVTAGAQESPAINASGLSVDYYYLDNIIKLGADLCLGPLVLGGSFGKGKENTDLQDVNQWDAHGGLRLRFPLIGRFLFVEGRALAGYAGTMVKNETVGVGYAGFTPRAELDFGALSFTVGYRWDFAEFKFDEQHMSKVITFGIGLGF